MKEEEEEKSLLLHIIPKRPGETEHRVSFIVFVSSPEHESAGLPARSVVCRGVNELSPHFTHSRINAALISRSHVSQRLTVTPTLLEKVTCQKRKKKKKEKTLNMQNGHLHAISAPVKSSSCGAHKSFSFRRISIYKKIYIYVHTYIYYY